MGIYIKSMRMPKDCKECDDVCSLSFIGCECYDFELNERPLFCPMSEVPELHGRLIDADKLKKEVLMWMPSDPCGMAEEERPIETDIVVSLMMEIEDAPTVIEGSELLEG